MANGSLPHTLKRRTTARLCLKNLGFIVYVLVATVALLEVCLRLFFPQPLTKDAPELYIPDDTIGWRRRPNAHGTARWQGPIVEVCTDSEADRISCLAKPARTCVARILAIGDPFVESLSVQYEETVWFRIEQDTGACVDVAGVGGYGPSQYLQVARERLKGRDPYQVVIINIYAGNDFKNDASKIPLSREVQRFRIRALPRGLTRVDFRNWLYPVNQSLESRSHAFVAFRNVFRRKYLAEHAEPALRPSQLTDRILEESLKPIRELAREATGAGRR